MKSLILFIFLAILISCKEDKQPNQELEVIDTQLAEIIPYNPPSNTQRKKDSLQIIGIWKKLYTAFKTNDLTTVKPLSTPTVYCPVYYKEFNYYNSYKPVSLYFLLNVPSTQDYLSKFLSLYKEQPRFYASSLRKKEIAELQLDTLKSYSCYDLSFLTTDTIRKYKITRTHSFKFLKKDNHIKFCGVEVEENGSRYLFDSTDNFYFPLTTKRDQIIPENALDTFSNKWYSVYLKEMDELNISKYKGADEIYRFTWFRSFHDPISIRFQRHDQTFELITKQMRDYNGYIPQEMIVNSKRELSFLEWWNFKQKIEDIDFWGLPSNGPPDDSTDGADWILEAVVKGKYHFTTRHSPYNSDYRKCCLYLLNLSRLNIPERNIY